MSDSTRPPQRGRPPDDPDEAYSSLDRTPLLSTTVRYSLATYRDLAGSEVQGISRAALREG
jgi:hypothetical protein